jgi:membrane protein DedA with SNARE-associated domain
MGNQIYLKIAGWVDLAVLIIFTPCQIFDIINGFWVTTQNLQFYYVLFLVTAAMLVGARHHRKQFWN